MNAKDAYALTLVNEYKEQQKQAEYLKIQLDSIFLYVKECSSQGIFKFDSYVSPNVYKILEELGYKMDNTNFTKDIHYYTISWGK